MLHKAWLLLQQIGRLIARYRNLSRPIIYRPNLSEEAFIAFLAQSKGVKDTEVDDSDITRDSSQSIYNIAIAFRNYIGERFFIRPSSVDKLCSDAYRSHPIWRKRLMESVYSKLNIGLAIYGTQVPRLTREFPWSSLPVGPGDDSLYPFRPHRFAFLPRIALAVYQQMVTSEQLVDIVDGWIEEAEKGQNPFCYGSNLVVIQRMLAILWAWSFLAARPPIRSPEGLGLEGRLLRILWSDARFLESRLGSSAPNNHLLVDRFAAYFLQAVIPEFFEHIDINKTAIQFRDELLRQTYEDGGSFEHSAHYHEFACEMGVAYLLICQRQGHLPDPKITKRVEALLCFQAALTGPEAKPLAIGNTTEDTLFPLDNSEGWCSGSLRELYRTLFHANVTPAPEDDPSIERAFWLLNGELQEPNNSTKPDLVSQSFPESGIYVYPDEELNGRLTFRSGPPMGTPTTAGHMHADFLSVYLSLEGHTVLDDAGTYTYRSSSERWAPGTPAWRTYFAGPAAHNTLNVEGHDPLGEISGDFRPFELASRVQCRYRIGSDLSWSEGKLFNAGSYSGYTRGCIHVKGCYWIIYDYPPHAEINDLLYWYGFQFTPGTRISTKCFTTSVEMPNSETHLSLITSLPSLPSLLEGSTDPLGGWVSPSYGLVLPAPQLRYALEAQHCPSAFVLTTQSGVCTESVSVELQPDGSLILRLLTNIGEDLLVLGGNMDKLFVSEGLIFEGQLLWVRIKEGRPVMIRWLNGRRVEWREHDLYLELAGEASNVTLNDSAEKNGLDNFQVLHWPKHHR